jgi:hypothetical protein
MQIIRELYLLFKAVMFPDYEKHKLNPFRIALFIGLIYTIFLIYVIIKCG